MLFRHVIKYLIFSVGAIGVGYLLSPSYASSELPSCSTQLSAITCQKIGQMLIVGFGGLKQDQQGQVIWQDPDGMIFKENSAIAHAIKNQHIGGVILFNKPFRNQKTGAFIRDRNIQSPDQVRKLATALQTYSTQIRKVQNLPPLKLLITIDQEGGTVDRLPVDLNFAPTFIPQALGMNEEKAMTNEIEKRRALAQTKEYADQLTAQLVSLRINLNFAPTVDVNINPLNAVIGGRGRSFSANPQVVADQAQQFIAAFHQQGVIGAIKHFPGHGSSTGDTHKGLVDVTDSYQMAKELLPYRVFIKHGYQDLIMTTHVINGQFDKSQCRQGDKDDRKTWCPGTMSYATLTKLLRQQLGFKGVIVSDDMTMGAIADEYPLSVALEKAINAGVNMFIVANNTADESAKVIDTIAKLVKEKKVSEAKIEESYQRIVALKERHFR